MKNILLPLIICLGQLLIIGQSTFEPLDVFDLEFADNPQISPDGQSIVYARSFMDVMTDKRLSNLWMTNLSGTKQRPLTSGNVNHFSHKWSPDGSSLAYLSTESGKTQIHMLWLDNGQSAKLTNLQESPSQLEWSPDGKWLAFSMRVNAEQKAYGNMPDKPAGAEWATPPKYIDRLVYRFDGAGFIGESYRHVFVIPASGGTPRQITTGEFNHSNPSWGTDSKTLYFSSNRQEDWEYNQQNTEIFKVDLSGDDLVQLTNRTGPDGSPKLSDNGQSIAYLGYDDKKMGYHHTRLYVMNADGSQSKCVTCDLDMSVDEFAWNNNEFYVKYSKYGNTKIAKIDASGNLNDLVHNLGGTSIGRPYDGGSFDTHTTLIAYTSTTPTQPTELSVKRGTQSAQTITHLNDDILAFKELGEVEEIWYESSHDGQRVQGWIMTPPDFDPDKKYPLLLEIHGGPFANYGDRFSAELQLLASNGYVVLYTNPRGSTSYGADFANLIHHNYPSNDYDDLMSGVDAVIAKGYIDEDRLFVTGGSGGGVLTSWIIGKTDRFRAAVVAKPVINWYSWALTADISGVVDYWFPGVPWEHQEHYMKRSPISLVGNVTTPTMLLTGEEDYRTPMSESEQYYQALKLQKVPSALVRIQEASHGIAAKPSNLLAKVSYIASWFEQWDISTPLDDRP